MAVVPKGKRVKLLQKWGLSKPIIQLSKGTVLDEVFEFSCKGPPFYVYNGADVPEGPELAPLWESYGTVFGVWERDGKMEFIEFIIESSDEFEFLSRTEQGFWVTQFDFLYETDESVEAMTRGAEKVGFKYLDLYLESRKKVESKLKTFAAHAKWRKALVEEVDKAAGG